MSTAAPLTHCANCEAPLTGHFCANCGQEAVLHHASTREFLHEFIGHYVALEGKLWGSLKRLILKPGELTNEYIRGRRVRYVQPLRLYLTFSVLFFALLKLTGGSQVEGRVVDGDSTAAKVTAPARELADKAARETAALRKPMDPAEAQSKVAAEAAVGEAMKDMGAEDARSQARAAEAERKAEGVDVNISDEYIGDKLSGWPTLQHQWHAFNQLPAEEQLKALRNGMHHYAPYAVFCLMPVFALMLKVLYLGSGRRFGEHMLFALHTNGFAFLMFSAILLARIGILQFALWCWLIAYLPLAMRRVYHSSRIGTLLRWALLMLAYLIALGLAVAVSAGMGVLTVGH